MAKRPKKRSEKHCGCAGVGSIHKTLTERLGDYPTAKPCKVKKTKTGVKTLEYSKLVVDGSKRGFHFECKPCKPADYKGNAPRCFTLT